MSELTQLRAEVTRLHEGEADNPGPDESVPTPAQWLRRFNDATPERRLEWAERAIVSSGSAARCFELDHEGRLAFLLAEVDRLTAENERLVARLAAVEKLIETVHADPLAGTIVSTQEIRAALAGEDNDA